MNDRKPPGHKHVFRASILAIATSLTSSAAITRADTSSIEPPDFEKRIYLGIGLGASTLQPNPRQSDILVVGDDRDQGFHLNLGYDIRRWLSAELYLAYLGEAVIDRVDPGNEQEALDSIDYLIADVAVLGYLFNNRSGFLYKDSSTEGMFCREALSLYGKLGLGVMRNEDEKSMVTHGRNFRTHVTVGVGLEYGFRNGFGIRGEWTGFDSDARYLNVSLVKRLGKSYCQLTTDRDDIVIGQGKGNTPDDLTNDKPEPESPPVPVPVAVPTILFDFDQSTPDSHGTHQLLQFTEQIRDLSGTVKLTGHTDWSGSDEYNDRLSQRRVIAVRQQLIDNGIAASAISTEFRGEKNPVDDNNTKTGRAQNRRVDILFTEN